MTDEERLYFWEESRKPFEEWRYDGIHRDEGYHVMRLWFRGEPTSRTYWKSEHP
jgi:hypothetical protein